VKDDSPAPTPDPKIGEAALKSAQMGEEWLSFAKDSFAISQTRQAELDTLTKRVTEQQLGLAEEAAANARADRERYETVYKPREDAFIDKAANYASAENQEKAAGEASATIQQQSAAVREAAQRRNDAMGVRPDSGRAEALDRTMDIETTLGLADAQNKARQGVRDTGLALEADVLNMGRGLPAQAAAGAGQSAALGSNAVGLSGAGNDAFIRSTNIMGTGFDAASRGYGNQANILNGLHQGQLDVWKTNRQAQSQEMAGWGSAIGTGLGLILSDEEAKEDKVAVPEGEALEAVRNLPVEEWTYKPGEGDGERHIGTYAQDFQKQTGKGDGENIPVVDAIGVTMKAVQDLATQVDRISEAIGLGGGESPVNDNATVVGTGQVRRPPVRRQAA
jgi:hypothetical protein